MTLKSSGGVTLTRLKPGGKDGPNGEVRAPVRGGNVWTEMFYLGHPEDPQRLVIPDIRMPPNQYWPPHWHDCWIAVVILDGECLIGDWWMGPHDLLISAAHVEYGPVVNGPAGCQLLEIFHNEAGAGGGYALEYHDHPTLTSDPQRSFQFRERSAQNQRNAGHQTLPIDGVQGLTKGHLNGGQWWDLGEPGDPGRGVLLDTRLEPGEDYPPRWHADWRAVLVIGGSMKVGGAEIGMNDLLIVQPGVELGPFEPGPEGVHLLEVTRTAAGADCMHREAYRDDPRYRAVLARSSRSRFPPRIEEHGEYAGISILGGKA